MLRTLLLCLFSLPLFAKSPNVILVFIDDMGWGDFSCYGNTQASTPNIDALAKEGLRFEQFYVNSPICSPSRVAITTGMFPARYRITSFINDRKGNAQRGMADWLDPTAPTLPRTLQSVGYYTGHFGKWHMGGGRDITDAPYITEYGFDSFLTNFEGMGNKVLGLCMKPGAEPSKKYFQSGEKLGSPYKWVPRHEVTTNFVDAAIGHMDKAKELKKPFYLNLWPDDVHSPFYPSPEKWDDNLKTRYLTVLEEMDQQLGKLFDYVKGDPELRDNTMILLTNDNGPSAGLHSEMPFKGWKTFVDEGGIRSPFIVWAPSLIPEEKKGSVNKESVFSAVDLIPSVSMICGGSLYPCDGEELSETLLGKNSSSREAPLFFSRPTDQVFKSVFGVKGAPELAVRDGKWKYLCNRDGTNGQLYDLDTDSKESNNLAEQNVAIVIRLKKSLLSWFNSMP